MPAGVSELPLPSTELTALLEGLCATLEPQVQARGLTLRTEWDAPLPHRVWIDRSCLRQILMNLLCCALKHTRAGELCLRARAEPLPVGVGVGVGVPGLPSAGLLRLQVHGEGMDLAPEVTEAMAQPLVLAHERTPWAHTGADLGLTVSRQLTLKMGGQLTALAAPGQGTGFELSLPCQVLPAVSAQAGTGPVLGVAAYVAALPCAAPLQILLAEDNAVNQQVMVWLLQKLGHAVTVVGDGLQALQALAKNRYDVLLLDVMMPVADGLQVLQALRGEPVLAIAASPCDEDWPRPLPQVLMVTAQAMPEDLERFVQAGACGVLIKPVSIDQLCRGLQAIRPVH